MIRILVLLVLGLTAASASAQSGDTPLFAGNDVIRITISGPVTQIARTRSEDRHAGTLTVAGTSEALPITLSARGITRLKPETCQFPPLWVRFTGPVPAQSLFAGQKSLKLVTHCRAAQSFQQHLLLEYAAYRVFNVLTPASFRVRLAMIDYADERGKPVTTRYGFFIEDLRDVARRNGMQEAKLGQRIPTSALNPAYAARYALFQHMIANHDWSMRAAPPGDECCHNAKLIAPARGVAAGVIPVPYDFDYSGLVSAPYAEPPDMLKLSSVRERLYRGYCELNNAALGAAVQFQAKRPAMLAALAETPGLEQRTVQRATSFVEGFFPDVASSESVKKLVESCI